MGFDTSVFVAEYKQTDYRRNFVDQEECRKPQRHRENAARFHNDDADDADEVDDEDIFRSSGKRTVGWGVGRTFNTGPEVEMSR